MNLYALMNTTAYKPKADRVNPCPMVGRDVMPLREASKAKARRNTISIDDSVKISDAAKARYASGASGLTNFKHKSWEIEVRSAATQNGVNSMTVVSKELGVELSFTWQGDARLDLSAEGGPKLITGKDALTGGVLKGTSKNEILLRASADVEGGDYENVVVGLTGESGNFTSSLGGTRYVGRFEGAAVYGMGGKDVYEGTFTGSQVNGGDGRNEYSGNFFNTALEGGAGQDVFSGLFLGNSTINGNAGNDQFTGTFFDSKLDGGKGNDQYGKMTLHDAAKRGKNFDGFVADVNFWGSGIVDESGDNEMSAVMKDSTAEFKNGNNVISGAFVNSSVDAGDGNNEIKAFYAESSNFLAGDGNDVIRIATGLANNISAGNGDNETGLGVREFEKGWSLTVENGGHIDMSGLRWGRDVLSGLDVESQAFGHQQGNFVDVGQGSDLIRITVDNVTRTVNSAEKVRPSETTAEDDDMRPAHEIEAENQLKAGAQLLAGASANGHLAGKTELGAGEYINPYRQMDANRLMGAGAVRPGAGDEEGFPAAAAMTLEGKAADLALKAARANVDRANDGVVLAFADGSVERTAVSTFKADQFAWINGETQAGPVSRVLRAAMKAYQGA